MGYECLKFSPDSVFLVTGGAGFIGSNICEVLINLGCRVKCLDDLSTGKKENLAEIYEHKNFTFISGDIRDLEICLEACKQTDFVIHQAAWGSVPRSIEMPLLYEEINIKGTLNMLEAARQNKVKKFVYASSSSVYGDEITLPRKEGKEGQLLSPYALTKSINEEYARLYYTLYGLETIGLRYFNVFGRKQNPTGYYAAVIPKFIKLLLNNEAPTINGDGRQSRDFTYIDNVIEANLRAVLATSKASGKVFNIAFGEQIYLIDIYEKLCALLGKDISPYYGPDRVGDILHSHADISKAKEFLNYNPSYSFSDGIELALKWYQGNMGG